MVEVVVVISGVGGCICEPVVVKGVKGYVNPPITTAVADGASEITVPATVIAAPGRSVCEAIKKPPAPSWAVSATPSTVSTGAGIRSVGFEVGQATGKVEPSTTRTVAGDAREIVVPASVSADPGSSVCEPIIKPPALAVFGTRMEPATVMRGLAGVASGTTMMEEGGMGVLRVVEESAPRVMPRMLAIIAAMSGAEVVEYTTEVSTEVSEMIILGVVL